MLPIVDHIVGWFGTVGVLEALRRRAAEGGSYRVRVSLTRVSLWLMSLGILDKDFAATTAGSTPEHTAIAPQLFTAETPLVTYQGVTDQIEFSSLPQGFTTTVLQPMGANRPVKVRSCRRLVRWTSNSGPRSTRSPAPRGSRRGENSRMDIRQVVITRAGAPERLKLQMSWLDPPAPGEVQVEVIAAGINFADILARQGLYPDAPPLPLVAGYEVSGTVRAVGTGVEESLVGQEVFALTRFGGYSSALNVPVAQVFAKPGVLSHAEAASIPVSYLTAWQLLVVQGGLREGDTVLIQNAGSGVGLAALDIARHVGARSIGTASAGKHDFLTARGLDHAVDYRSGDWTREVRALTGNRGVELVIDPLGGESFRRSRTVLRPTGRLGMYGVSAASNNQGLRGKLQLARTAALMPLFHPVSLMNANQGAFGVNLGHMWGEVDRLRRWMEQVLEGVQSGWVRPHVDSSYPLADAGRAHEHIEARRSTGKVVLEP